MHGFLIIVPHMSYSYMSTYSSAFPLSLLLYRQTRYQWWTTSRQGEPLKMPDRSPGAQLLAVLWTGLPCPMGAGHCDGIVFFSPVDTLLETIITPILGKCVFHLFLFFLCPHFSELNALKFTWFCAGKYERYWLNRLRL